MKSGIYSFWQLLVGTKVVIPIIQRDYAQGRKDEKTTSIRRKFLVQLHDALSGTHPADLDFVYGTINGQGEMLPLDGQQRLTTLWLLHWYVACKSGLLAEKDSSVRDTLKKFTYETRTSSREFCERLCEMTVSNGKSPVSAFIQDQTWFYSAWKQDPTIQAMLRMLSGTGNKDGDGIEQVFQGNGDPSSDSFFKECWEKLADTASEGCPIRFRFLPLGTDELPVADDLYIKMNARGKPLTDFENFKADLTGWMETHLDEGPADDFAEQLAEQLDNKWTDIFWTYRSEDGRIDEIFLAFLNRYFLNEYIVTNATAESSNDTGEWSLYESDSKIVYKDFEVYQQILDGGKWELLKRLDKIFKFIQWYRERNPQGEDINSLIQGSLPKWYPSQNFNFIPVYTEDKKNISALTQSQRVVFHAICRYFEKVPCDETNVRFDGTPFRHWMRVVCNLVANPEIDGRDSMVGRMKLIDELARLSNGWAEIYEFLARPDALNAITSNAARPQLEEEAVKARAILNEKNGSRWETLIIDAESHPLLCGRITWLCHFIQVQNEDAIVAFRQHLSCFKRVFPKGFDPYDYLWVQAFLTRCERKSEESYFEKGSVIDFSNGSKRHWCDLINDDFREEFRSLIPVLIASPRDGKTFDEKMGDMVANACAKPSGYPLWFRPLFDTWTDENGKKTCLLNVSSKIKKYSYGREGPQVYLWNKHNWTESNVLLSTKRNDILVQMVKDPEFKLEKPELAIQEKFFRGWDVWAQFEGHWLCFRRTYVTVFDGKDTQGASQDVAYPDTGDCIALKKQIIEWLEKNGSGTPPAGI